LILSSDKPINHYLHDLSLKTLTFKQRLYLNSFLINMDNKKNKFLSGHYLIDLFPNRFSFYLWKKNIKNHIKNLDDITLIALFNLFSSIVISDISIKNLITMFISHIYMHNKPIIKTIYYAINITFTKAELFVIHCSICYSLNVWTDFRVRVRTE